MLYSEQPTVLLVRRHLNTMLLSNFENLNSISNIFREAHDFLVLTDPPIICISLRTTDRHFRGQGNVLNPTSKLLKSQLLQTLNTFRNPSLRIFAARKASPVIIQNYSTYWYIISAFWRILIGKGSKQDIKIFKTFSFPDLQASHKYKICVPEDEVGKRYLTSNFIVKSL